MTVSQGETIIFYMRHLFVISVIQKVIISNKRLIIANQMLSLSETRPGVSVSHANLTHTKKRTMIFNMY